MNDILALKYGVAGVCVMFTILILVEVAKFYVRHRQQRESTLEDTIKALTKATVSLENRLGAIEKSTSDVPKLREDLRKFYSAIKTIAGDKWPQIRDDLKENPFG